MVIVIIVALLSISSNLFVIPHLKPRDVGLWRGVDDADDLRLVALARVDERLLLLDLGRV